jgi:hypothetical protein
VDQVADRLAEKVKVAKVDVDAAPKIAQRFSIRAIPTLVVFKNGKLEKQFVGLTKAHTAHRNHRSNRFQIVLTSLFRPTKAAHGTTPSEHHVRPARRAAPSLTGDGASPIESNRSDGFPCPKSLQRPKLAQKPLFF